MNIFEGITKEKFIKEFNKRRNGSLTILHIYLAFDYKNLIYINYSRQLKSISDVQNYEEEIEFFNSFKPFLEYEGKPVLVMDNYNEYLTKKAKMKLSFATKKKANSYCTIDVPNLEYFKESADICVIQSEINFKRDVKLWNKIRFQDFLSEELNKRVEEFGNKISLVLKERFIEFEDKGYKNEFSLKFAEFEQLKDQRKLLKKHLNKNNFFDEFRLALKGNFSTESFYNQEKKPIPFDNYFELIEEYFLSIKDVGEYFNYDIIVHNFFEFTFKKR